MKYPALLFLCLLSTLLMSNTRLINFECNSNNKLHVYFESSEPITGSNSNGFLIEGKNVTGISINNNQTTGHYLILDDTLSFWDNLLVRYTGGSNIQNSSSEPLNPFTLIHVENKIPEPTPNGNTYYVNAAVNSSGNGLSENTAFKTISEASNIVSAGDVVYIKAGDYGGETIDSFEDGDEDSPIWYIGYKSTPGDITSRYYNYGDGALDPNEMPLLDGGSRTNSDGAITIANHPYNILKNIQVTRYRFGFYNNNSFGVIFENCIIKDLGDWPSGNYGLGFLHMGNASNCRVINCLAINAEDMLYKFQGNHHLILNNEGFCDDSDFEQSTDYYMNFNAGSSYNIIKGNYLKRVVSGAIVGHGLNIYGDGNGSAMSKYNLILDQTSINFGKGMELRHDGVAYNIIRGLECYEEGGVSGNCVEIRDGAHDNIFENAYIHDLHNATQWSGSTESGTGSGYNNIFNNCIFENFQALNAVSGAFDNPEVAGNLYQNCTIVNTSSQGEVNENSNATTSSGNEFVNCIFENVQALGSEEGYSYTHCNFHNSFSAPSGVSISNHDPMFVDASNSNYRLQGGSPLIDIGTTVSDLYLDFDNNDRFQGSGMDLGAFEFNLNVSSTEQMVTSYEYDVFPNPSKGIFNLTVNKVPVQVQIFDLSGRLVSQEFINQKNSMINLEGQKNGFYLMEIHGFDTHSQTKLILSSN